MRAAPTPGARARIIPAVLHAEQHLDEPLRLADLAAVAGFSPNHFHRVFTEAMGETPKQHLLRLRLERAVMRLKVSPDNVLEIALAAGFATNETFTRAFARRFGLTPSEFRKVVRGYREAVGDAYSSSGYEPADGFTDDTPLVLRFDMRRAPVEVVRTPERHLVFVRHLGFESLLADGRTIGSLWDPVVAAARSRGLTFDPELRIAITHDDPYVTDEHAIRFDACLVVDGPVEASDPLGYRRLEPGLCVARRHDGGLEEIARTFAYIGVEWLPSDDYVLSAAPPFEVRRGPQVVAHVPLDPRKKERR